MIADGRRGAAHSTLTLAAWVRRRNGLPLGAPGSLSNMLRRSLGARSFAAFWRYWNPIFGYLLARHVHAPLLRVTPAAFALVATFVVCGALHDAVTMLVRGAGAFLFTPWFFFLGLGVLAGEALHMNLSRLPFPVRVLINLAYVAAALALALAVRAPLAELTAIG